MSKNLSLILLLSVVVYGNLFAQQPGSVFATANLTRNAQKNNNAVDKKTGFISIKGINGVEYKVYAAGPEDAGAGILFVHDFFGISDAAKESVEKLAATGYRVIAVDLYNGKSATTNEAATKLMNAKDAEQTAKILRAGIDYLKHPGRKLATIGFSAGGIDAMNANLMEPELVKATIIVYGGSYDMIEKVKLDKLRSPVLAIAGALDNWPLQAAVNFMTDQKYKFFEMYVYPGVDHGYAQPLFSEGKNFNADATQVTWNLIDRFLAKNLGKSNPVIAKLPTPAY